MSNVSEQLTNLILSHVGPLTNTPSGFRKRNCMMCYKRGHRPDTRSRFGIKLEPESIGMKCFNCNFSAGWNSERSLSKDFIDFLREINITDFEIRKIQFEIFKYSKDSHEEIYICPVEKDITDKWETVELPESTKTLGEWISANCTDANFLQCIKYVTERGLFNKDELYWTPSKNKQMHKRILLPFTYKGNVVGYTGRYYKDIKSNLLPKYTNHMPAGFLFNLDKQVHDNKYLIVCEGVFDAFLMHGVSSLGSINEDQIKLINGLNKVVIVSPDRDKDGTELIEVALENGWAVSFPKWGRGIKDAAKAVEVYGKIFTAQSIIQYAEYRKFNIKLKRRMDKM